jgi:acetyl esterase/lipase
MIENADVAARIASFGRDLGPHLLLGLTELFGEEQRALARAVPVADQDVTYGPHPRHRLDIYRPKGGGLTPVLVFVHGGGFVRGDKGDNGSLMNSNLGRIAARAGFMGVVINYRLAPENMWPAGSQDVASVVAWLKRHAAEHGGDPQHIVLCGTSAGAVHVSGYVKHVGCGQAEADVRGLILLSGLYGYTPPDERDELYTGHPSLYPQSWTMEALAQVKLPIMACCAQYDPVRFQTEWVRLLQDRLDAQGSLPSGSVVSDHNHYSITMHIGTNDRRLENEIIAFVRRVIAD